MYSCTAYIYIHIATNYYFIHKIHFRKIDYLHLFDCTIFEEFYVHFLIILL